MLVWLRQSDPKPNSRRWRVSLMMPPTDTVMVQQLVVIECITMPSRWPFANWRSEEHTSELQSRGHLVCRLLLAKKKRKCARAPSLLSHHLSTHHPPPAGSFSLSLRDALPILLVWLRQSDPKPNSRRWRVSLMMPPTDTVMVQQLVVIECITMPSRWPFANWGCHII